MTTIPRRIFIDSSFRTSGTHHGDFEVILPWSFEVPEGFSIVIDNFSCPHEFGCIHDGIDRTNHTLCYSEMELNGSKHKRTAVIPSQHYDAVTLAAALEVALNSGSFMASPGYSVSFDEAKGRLNIVGTQPFKIWTTNMLRNGCAEDEHFSTNPITDDCGAVIGFSEGQTFFAYASTSFDFVDTQAIKNIYLASNLGSYSSMGCRGERDIIRKIPVDVPYGGMIQHSGNYDHIDCAGETLSSLRFSLRDVYGRVLKLTRPVSFSLLLVNRHALSF